MVASVIDVYRVLLEVWSVDVLVRVLHKAVGGSFFSETFNVGLGCDLCCCALSEEVLV